MTTKQQALLLGASLLAGVLIGLTVLLASKVRSADNEPEVARTRIRLDINPYVDAYLKVWVYSKTTDEPIPAGLQEAV
jgi:hypothetical protein